MNKAVKISLALIIVILIVAGCGNGANSSKTDENKQGNTSATIDNQVVNTSTTEPELAGKITLLWHRNKVLDAVMRPIAEAFMEMHPGVEIEVEGFMDESIVKTRIAANEMPDIMIVPAGLGITRESYSEFFIDISDIGFTKENLDFYDDGTGTDGKLYTITSDKATLGLVYNKKTFKLAGIDTIPTTIDELYAAMEKLKDNGIIPLGTSFMDKWPLLLYTEGFAPDATGDPNFIQQLVNSDKYLDESTPGGYLDGLNLLKSFINKGYTEPDLMSANWGSNVRDLAQGKLGMIFAATFLPQQVFEFGGSPEEIGMFPFPEMKARIAVPGRYYGVTNSSKHPDVAKAFLEYMWAETDMLEQNGFISPLKDYEPNMPFFKELKSFSLPEYEIRSITEQYQSIINKAQIDNMTLAQEFITAKDTSEIVDRYNKKWAAARKALTK